METPAPECAPRSQGSAPFVIISGGSYSGIFATRDENREAARANDDIILACEIKDGEARAKRATFEGRTISRLLECARAYSLAAFSHFLSLSLTFLTTFPQALSIYAYIIYINPSLH